MMAASIVPHEARCSIRAASAFLGAVTGDAAAQTSHWNYDRPAYHKALKQAGRFDSPEFFESNQFYVQPVGLQSCYGDQMVEIARHLTKLDRSKSDAVGALTSGDGQEALIGRFEKSFGSESAYGSWPTPAERESNPPPRPEMPISGPWRHGSLKGFLDNVSEGRRTIPESGSDDSQFDAVAKSIPVVCAFAGDPRLLELVEVVVRLTQNTDVAVAYARLAARILESIILGVAKDVPSALRMAIDAENADLDANDDSGDQCKARHEACVMLNLVSEILELEPPSFEEAVAVLGSEKAMKEKLSSPMTIVA